MIDRVDNDEKAVYEFEGFRLDASKRLLFNGDEPVALMPKALDILLYLVERAGSVADKDEIMAAIWPDTIVEENNLTQNISALRRALGEKHRENRFIATVPGRGYKFVAEVRPNGVPEASPEEQPETELRPQQVKDTHPRRWFLPILVVLVLAAVAAPILILRNNRKAVADEKIRSLAVLPFRPLVAESRDESLELGMTDTMIGKLGGGEIQIRPLSAVRRFNSLEQDPLAAGRELGVDAVLDGSIQIAGGRVRVLAKLARVNDGKQIWAGQFNEAASDIFALQDSISERVAGALQIALGERSRKNYTASVEAYQLFAKGKFHSSRLILPEVQKGISYFEQAIAADPNYAMAYVELSNAYRAMVLTNDVSPADAMPKARDYALRAAELDPTLSEAQTVLAFIAFWYEFDPAKAEPIHRRAIELDPSSPQSHFGYAHFLSNTGRHDEALAEIKRALELDPVSLVTNALYGQVLFFAGQEDEALRVLQATSDLDQNFWLPHLFISRIYAKKGMWDESIAAASRARDLSNGNAEAIANIGYAQAKAARTAEAQNLLVELKKRSETRYVPHYALAALYNGLGDREKALDSLEKAFTDRDSLMVFLKVEPKWDNLRSDPRFIELMKRMNFD